MVTHTRLGISLLLLLLLGMLACAPSAGAVPAGPRIAFLDAEYLLRMSKKSKVPEGKTASRFVSVDAAGHDPRALLGAPSIEELGPRVAWTVDGSEFAFVGKPAGSESAPDRIYLAQADGSAFHAIHGTAGASDPVLSPAGDLLAFSLTRVHYGKLNPKNPKTFLSSFRHSWSSTTTWIVPTAGGTPRRLTPWGKGRYARPSSISPDEATVAVTVERRGAKQAIDAIDVATGKARTLVVEGAEAAYSPDGSEIAFTSYRDGETIAGFDGPEAVSELEVSAADGTGVRRLTHTPHMQEGEPTWDPSGTRLAYRRAPGDLFGLFEASIVESNADGSCPLVLPTAAPRHKGWDTLLGAPSWVPGEGRAAGPLSC